MRRFHRRHANEAGIPAEQQKDYVECAICHFPAVPLDWTPGENFPFSETITGTKYVWTAAGDSIADLDYRVSRQVAEGQACPRCFGTRYLDGSWTSGLNTP